MASIRSSSVLFVSDIDGQANRTHARWQACEIHLAARDKYLMKHIKRLFSVFCRMVGPGGTTVDFYPAGDKIKAVWSNENCPYEPYGHKPGDDKSSWQDVETYEAKDGHNVSEISWQDLEEALIYAIKKKLYQPSKLRLP